MLCMWLGHVALHLEIGELPESYNFGLQCGADRSLCLVILECYGSTACLSLCQCDG